MTGKWSCVLTFYNAIKTSFQLFQCRTGYKPIKPRAIIITNDYSSATADTIKKARTAEQSSPCR